MKKPLSFFRGFVPLFVQWVDTDIVSKKEYVAINEFLKKELRPDVIYLAISQVDLFWFVFAGASVEFEWSPTLQVYQVPSDTFLCIEHFSLQNDIGLGQIGVDHPNIMGESTIPGMTLQIWILTDVQLYIE